MEGFIDALVITYFVGCLAGFFVLPWRVGLDRSSWLVAFLHPGSRRNGIPWAVKSFIKLYVWPAVFVMWLVQGRPASSVLYGAAAAQQLYGDPSKAMPGFITKWQAG